MTARKGASDDDGCGCLIVIIIVLMVLATVVRSCNKINDLENRVEKLETK